MQEPQKVIHGQAVVAAVLEHQVSTDPVVALVVTVDKVLLYP
jgi:hypothetical protein